MRDDLVAVKEFLEDLSTVFNPVESFSASRQETGVFHMRNIGISRSCFSSRRTIRKS